MEQKIFDPSTLNIINPDREKTIFDPGSEWMQELKNTSLRLSIRPRKVDMMQAQVGMIADMMSEEKSKKVYVPSSAKGNKGGFVLK